VKRAARSVAKMKAPDAVNRLIKRIGERAGFAFTVHCHMLRHACGCALANAGHDTRALQDWLGHRSIQHTVPLVNPVQQVVIMMSDWFHIRLRLDWTSSPRLGNQPPIIRRKQKRWLCSRPNM
jgi:integrase